MKFILRERVDCRKDSRCLMRNLRNTRRMISLTLIITTKHEMSKVLCFNRIPHVTRCQRCCVEVKIIAMPSGSAVFCRTAKYPTYFAVATALRVTFVISEANFEMFKLVFK